MLSSYSSRYGLRLASRRSRLKSILALNMLRGSSQVLRFSHVAVQGGWSVDYTLTSAKEQLLRAWPQHDRGQSLSQN